MRNVRFLFFRVKSILMQNKTSVKIIIKICRNLPVLYKGTITRGNDSQLSYSGLGSNKNIRKAGLVKIGGAYHKILGISGDTLTFENECSTSFTEAEFVYAMVADNNDNGESSRDDGDAMAESYSKAGDYWTWDATINSTNIPDGPVTVNVVVFDKAGNFAHGSVKTRISNSPVRITSVKLATDLNSNGTFEESEYEQFYAFKNADGSANTSKGIDVWNLDTKEEQYGNSPTGKYWAVKDRLAVVPEFVGGTGPFYWNFTKSEAGENLESAKSLAAQDSIKIENKQEFILGNAELDDSTGEGKDAAYQFSFWDSTEELTPGTDTSWTVLNAHVRQELTDSVAPTITIKPFYWNSGSDNSLYRNSKEEGHIELEGDLDFAGSAFTQNSGLYDKDPKVSGRIKIQGSANDNKILKDIKVEISGLLNETVGTYTKGSGWNDSRTEGEVEAKLESGSSWAFTIDEEEISQESGHTVKWTLTVDTSKISGVAKLDVAAKASATDQSSNASQPSAAQTAQDNETSYYRMDVVPYITKLYTNISDSAGEDFARSATGKYIVHSNENIRMYGFNLVAGTNNVSISDTKITTSAGDGTYINLPVGTTTVSGKVSVTVNSIESLNNVNANPEFKSETDDTVVKNEYNCQANGTTNNRLTDDVELYIWDMGYFLQKTDITSPIMKMDSDSNYYMSYGYGIPSMYVNKNGSTRQVDYSYNKFHNTNVSFDDNGNIYAVATNTDRIENDSAKFTFYTPYSNSVSNQMPAYVWDNTRAYTASSTSKRQLETVYNSSTSKYDINRVKRPKITTYTDGDTTYIAMAYYDYNNTINPVKFRFGSRNGTNISGGITGNVNGLSQSNNPEVNDSSASGYHIVASSNTSKKGGEYASCGIVPISNGYVGVVAWYDASVRKICYSYNANPDSAVVGGDWQNNAIYLDDLYTGWYVDMCVDKDGGIHIAYYNSAKGDLKYAYLKSYDDKNPAVVTVDSYLSVGTNISINTRLENEKYVPYIYYYNASSNQTMNSIKVAWQNDVSSVKQGAIGDKFTGAWECMTIPTTNIPVDATVCGGVPTTGEYGNAVVLGYMSDTGYERAVLNK